MKNILSLCLAFFALCSFAQADPTPKQPVVDVDIDWNFPQLFGKKNATVTLPSGTIILLETAEKLESSQLTVGKPFRFRVVSNVMADGKIVIRTGAFAIGRVKNLGGSTYNSGETLTVELQYVQAVDGTSVSLMGDELTIAGRFAGQGTTLDFATTATAHVTNNTDVKVD